MANVPKIPLMACVVAFLSAGFSIFSALRGEIILLPFALVPLIAGIGILRRRVWSAYGFALILSTEVLVLALVFLRQRSGSAEGWKILLVAMFNVLLMTLFVSAGRSLALAGG